MERLAREAELAALKEQLNPHFLFNSLNSISALVTSSPPQARQMCVQLAGFLRATLGLLGKATIPLGEELSLVRNYLEIEKVRFGERLRVEERIDAEAARCGVPPLLLQPLVENAVKHGVAPSVQGGLVRLTARRADGDITIQGTTDTRVRAGTTASGHATVQSGATAFPARRRNSLMNVRAGSGQSFL